tara:strand:+ start:354 stop:554 length:201 start_codon:yes stop_codon:yes gene_type:complete
MNNFFGYLVVEKIKLTSFDSEKVINFKENNLKNNVTISKYEKKIRDVKNEKIKKSLLKLTKVFKNK